MPALTPLLLANVLTMAAMMSFVAVIGPLIRTLGLAEWHGGLAVTLAGVLWVLSARPWGRLSDIHGRKSVLLWSLLGLGLSFLALGGYVDLARQSAWPLAVVIGLMVFIRGMIGLFYTAVPVVSTAWLADHFAPDHRRGAMAKLGAVGAIGMVLGPLGAGFLATHGLSVPLYLAGLLPLIACGLLWFKIPAETALPQDAKPHQPFMDQRLRLPVIAMFLATCSSIAAQMCVGFFAMDRLSLDAQAAANAAGQTMASVGLTLILTQLAVARLHKVTPHRLIAAGALLAAVSFLPLLLTTSKAGLIISFSLAAAGLGMLIPAAQAMAANAVGASEQGLAAGTITAAQGLASVASPLTVTVLYQWDWRLPFVLACAALIALCLLTAGAMPWRRQVPVPPAP